VRKIIVHIASSADGYIARPDGDFEWLNRLPQPKGHYGMDKFVESIDSLLLGRKTYEIGLRFGGKNLGMGPGVRNYVFTHKPPRERPEGIEFVSEPVAEFAKRLRSEQGKNIWMMGGAEIVASFLDAGEIDEFAVNIIPVFIGEGIPLIAPRHRLIDLELVLSQPHPDGVVSLHYKLRR
jgi:dihydrofolate reductase